jgi:aspartate racemase
VSDAPAKLTVGVLGGMGPAATLDFFAKVLAATPAERDQDHLRLLIDNNPVGIPDRNAALRDQGPGPGRVLAAMARGLEAQGANFLVMPCNTAHNWQADIEAAVSIPFIGMIGETVRAAQALTPRPHRLGLLATAGGRALYEPALKAVGFEVLASEGEAFERLMDMIYRIKTGDVGPAQRAEAAALAAALVDRGAGAVVSACTELPLVLDAVDVRVPLLDATDVLVERTIAYATRTFPLPGH